MKFIGGRLERWEKAKRVKSLRDTLFFHIGGSGTANSSHLQHTEVVFREQGNRGEFCGPMLRWERVS